MVLISVAVNCKFVVLMSAATPKVPGPSVIVIPSLPSTELVTYSPVESLPIKMTPSVGESEILTKVFNTSAEGRTSVPPKNQEPSILNVVSIVSTSIFFVEPATIVVFATVVPAIAPSLKLSSLAVAVTVIPPNWNVPAMLNVAPLLIVIVVPSSVMFWLLIKPF